MKLRLADQPVAYTVLVKSILTAVVVLGWVTLTTPQIIALVAVFDASMATFIVASVTPTKRVGEQIETAVKAKQAEIHDFLAGATETITRPIRTK